MSDSAKLREAREKLYRIEQLRRLEKDQQQVIPPPNLPPNDLREEIGMPTVYKDTLICPTHGPRNKNQIKSRSTIFGSKNDVDMSCAECGERIIKADLIQAKDATIHQTITQPVDLDKIKAQAVEAALTDNQSKMLAALEQTRITFEGIMQDQYQAETKDRQDFYLLLEQIKIAAKDNNFFTVENIIDDTLTRCNFELVEPVTPVTLHNRVRHDTGGMINGHRVTTLCDINGTIVGL